MNYFTTEWWAGETTNGQATVEAYWQYLESIRDKLPASLVRFAYDFSLHDARITAAAFEVSSACNSHRAERGVVWDGNT
jgi:hypothetical protein